MQRFRRIALALAAGLLAATGLSLATQAPAQAASCTSYQYGYGGSGQCVKEIQTMLNGITYQYRGSVSGCGRMSSTYLTQDGQFGSMTLAVVKAFQKWDCLTPDGIVGRNTWRELCFLAGQVNFIYAGQPAAKRNAWYAARRAGCAVEYP